MSVFLLLAMAAGTVAMPAPVGSPNRWLGPEDIPHSEFEAGNDGAFFVKALVSPDGKVEQCRVQQASAPRAEWDAFCNRVKRRFGFHPVTDPQGAPSYYLLEENYAYVLPQTWVRNGVASQPDMVVDVQKLPGAKDGKLDVAVNVAIDAAGALRQCNAGADEQASLAGLACGQLQARWTPMPEKSAAGQPVAYIRQMKVQFREAKVGG